MAQDLSEKELLKMEVEQLKKEVRNPRAPVSLPTSPCSWDSFLKVWDQQEEVLVGSWYLSNKLSTQMLQMCLRVNWDVETSWRC